MTSHHSAFVPVVALKSSAYHGTPIRPLLNPSVPFLPIANPHGRIVKVSHFARPSFLSRFPIIFHRAPVRVLESSVAASAPCARERTAFVLLLPIASKERLFNGVQSLRMTEEQLSSRYIL